MTNFVHMKCLDIALIYYVTVYIWYNFPWVICLNCEFICFLHLITGISIFVSLHMNELFVFFNINNLLFKFCTSFALSHCFPFYIFVLLFYYFSSHERHCSLSVESYTQHTLIDPKSFHFLHGVSPFIRTLWSPHLFLGKFICIYNHLANIYWAFIMNLEHFVDTENESSCTHVAYIVKW